MSEFNLFPYAHGIIDRKRGGTNPRIGTWQGLDLPCYFSLAATAPLLSVSQTSNKLD